MDYLKILYQRDTRIEPSLDGITLLLERLGNPQKSIDSIQVGGTNGKTSTTHILSLLLQGQGLKVGRYTSPHLESFSERLAVNNQNVGENYLIDIIKQIFEDIQCVEREIGRQLTGFEILTACAFVHFKNSEVDVAAIEVGMGGRWDATSVVSPSLCAITNVEMDHMNYLGDTKVKIANEKIGIVKERCPLVTCEEDKKMLDIFKRHCHAKKSKIFKWPSEFSAELSNALRPTARIKGVYSTYNFPMLLEGTHQLKNISLATAAAELYFKESLNENNAVESLNKLNLGGRFEIVQREPLIVLDGAHNPAAVEKLVEEVARQKADKKIAIIAVLSDKDVNDILRLLSNVFDEAIITENESERCMKARELFAVAKKYFKKLQLSSSLEESIITAKTNASKKDLICVTGSLYTVGAAKRYFK